MDIRILKQEEILPALHMVWEVYAQDVIPISEPETIRAFQEYIKYENINIAVQKSTLTIFGAFEESELCGTIAITSDGRLKLFFVRKEWQGRGIGRMLFQAAYNYCVQNRGVRQITVNALPEFVERYRHLGMQVADGDIMENGTLYTPMETFAIPGLVQPVKKHGKAPLIVGIIVGVLLIAALVFAGYSLITGVMNMMETTIGDAGNSEDEYEDEFENPGEYDSGAEQDELSGINGIEEYIAEDLAYQIEDKNYSYSGENNSTTMIDFYVNYPVIQGLEDSAVEKKVNETIEQCAMKTVDEIYNNPSQEMKERVLNAQVPALVSYVNCKVSYANDSFISVVFEDYSYKGSQEYFDLNFRTLNIDLTDGAVYQVKDIVTLSDAFMGDWLDRMKEEAEDKNFLEEADLTRLKNALEGNSEDEVYEVYFFVSADQIEIGFDFNYPADSLDDSGYAWVTAPFEQQDLKTYATDSSFWKVIEK